MAIPAPSRFCTTANSEATAKKMSTCGPPTFSSRSDAAKPMLVKNATIMGLCSVVSNSMGGSPRDRAQVSSPATMQPADDGRGDVVAGQRRHQPANAVAQEEDDARKGDGLDQVELHEGISPPGGRRE